MTKVELAVKALMDQAMAEMQRDLERQIFALDPFLARVPPPPPVPWWTRRIWRPVRGYLSGWARALLGVWQALLGRDVLACDHDDDYLLTDGGPMPIESITCPKCGGPMASRLNKRTQQRFWGCRAFPACNGTRNTDGEAPRSYARADADAPDRDERLPSERRTDRGWGR